MFERMGEQMLPQISSGTDDNVIAIVIDIVFVLGSPLGILSVLENSEVGETWILAHLSDGLANVGTNHDEHFTPP
jgi:hypothetical protein